jgi:transcriptional regulator with XRE-family HTH domain
MSAMSERLKKARNRLGMYQEEVANLMEMSRPTLSAIESGKRQVTAEEVVKFAEIYEVPADYILYGYRPTNGMKVELKKSEKPDMSKRLLSYFQKLGKLSPEDQAEIMRLIDEKLKER